MSRQFIIEMPPAPKGGVRPDKGLFIFLLMIEKCNLKRHFPKEDASFN